MAENRREEQKLWLIVFQIKAIRTRLNLLAIQYWLYATIAVLIGAATLIFLAALALRPLTFLAAGVLVVVCALVAAVRVTRMALRSAANPTRAAAVADRRAELKGRLATVLALAETPPPSPLWPYLVEDTYALRQRFEPAVVEPRWISRSIVAPAAAGILAATLLMAVRFERRRPAFVSGMPPAELTADLGNLEIRPADPSMPANARVYADPATLRQLATKLAQAEKQEHDRGGVARWMSKARQLAGSLQDQVTGQKPLKLPPLTLRLKGEKSPPPAADSGSTPPAEESAGSHPSGAPIAPPGAPGTEGAPPGDSQPPVNLTPEDANRLAQNGLPAAPGDNSTGAPQDQAGAKVGSGYASEAGSDHSLGSDPEHLFGPPAPRTLGADSFKLTVEARPIDESSSGGAPAYLPPKVRVPLSAQQYPDEPLARAAVPFDDRATVKRVFER